MFVLLFAACNNSDKQNVPQGKPLAKVYDYVLYDSELTGIVPEKTSTLDSIEIVKKYIDNWVREILVMHQAENNLTDEQKNVEKQLYDYRNSLIIYAYEKELVNQKLDTTVNEDELAKYYQTHQSEFELKDNIIKVIYVKVNKKAPTIDKVKKWYQSDAPKDREMLANYCLQFAENFYLDENSWLLFDDLLKEIPIQTYNKELFLQNNRLVEVSDANFQYFLNIKGFKIRNSISPLSFERDNIKNIILNERKLDLINKMKDNVYKQALDKDKIEIYTNDK